jgi:hypothetical protein
MDIEAEAADEWLVEPDTCCAALIFQEFNMHRAQNQKARVHMSPANPTS